MDENSKKIIKDTFDSLPESVQEAIMSSHYEESLFAISKKYELTIEQMGILELQTTLVMMGLSPTTEFEEVLKKELNVDEDAASKIFEDISEMVFKSIRHLLQLMYTPEGEEPELVEEEEVHSSTLKELSPEVTPIIQSFTKKVETAPVPSYFTKAPEPSPDTQVLRSAGIEIVQNSTEKPKNETPITEKREEILSKVENPDDIIKKTPLNTSFETPAPQQTQAPTPSQTPPIAAVYTPPYNPNTTNTSVSTKKVDPYRMPIE